MKTILQLGLLACVLSTTGCGGDDADPDTATAPATMRTGLQSWTLPAGPGAAQPDLALAPDGRLLLSWLDVQEGRRTRFQFAQFGATNWDVTRTIAIGNSFFANWADTPHILATPNGALWVQWLQKSGAAPYAYDVVLSTSRNDGQNWSEPVRPHTDGTTTEHGFAALWPQGDDALGIAWLDGRHTADAAKAEPHAAHVGASDGAMMTLRTATFDGGLRTGGDIELDASVCDCCQTDAAITAKGPLLVYRDRTPEEIRDIRAVRFDGGAWKASKPVASDNWRMPACPVNGPSVAARGNDAVVAWYTAAGNVPAVKLAHSRDAGDSFGAPVLLEQGEAVQGRVDVAVDASAAWVLWTREDANGQSLWLARYAPDLSRQLEKVEVVKLQGRGRGTGFAQLVLRDGAAWIVWTDVSGGTSRLQGATYAPGVAAASP